MDAVDPEIRLEDRIRRLGLKRVQLHQDLATVEARLGPLLREAHRSGRSLSRLGRLIGATHPYVTHLIDTAADDIGPSGQWTLPEVLPSELADVVAGKALRRIIGAFDGIEVLYHSRLHPSVFVGDSANLSIPHVVIELDIDIDERWIGVADVNVGYGGTGPSNAFRLFQSLGFPSDICESVFSYRFFDLDCHRADFDEADSDHGPYPRMIPSLVGAAFAYQFEPHLWQRARHRSDDPTDGKAIESLVGWLKLGNDERADWAGRWEDRVVRVYLDRAAASGHGFVHAEGRWGGRAQQPSQVVFEQGEAQIWMPLPWPMDDTCYLGDEAYRALALFDLLPEGLLLRDNQGAAWRWLRSKWDSRRRPAYVDISVTGDRHLKHVPL